jgi:hypothetical protein
MTLDAVERSTSVTILDVQPVGPNGTDNVDMAAGWLS